MSQDANTPPAGGLKSALKVAVPLVALVAVIFGVTLFSMYTPKAADDGQGKDGSSAVTKGEPPLRFFNSTRAWDPPSLKSEYASYREMPLLAPSGDPAKALDPFAFSVQDRIFTGFYEPGTQERRTAFWFENRNPRPATMQLKGLGCAACSGARLAAIPPEVTKAYLQRTALGALPVGLFNAFGVGVADPAADFAKLEWTAHKFSENPNATYKVPAAPGAVADKWLFQWGVLEFTFTVSTNPKVPLWAEFATQVDGSPDQAGGHRFEIYFAPSEPCVVSQGTIDAGEINPLTPEREYQFLVFSATRGPGSEFGDLTEPKCSVQAPQGIEPGEFVKVTKVERLPETALAGVAQDFAQQKKMTKVRAAYRVTVAVRREVGVERLDLGKMDRTIYIAIAGESKPQAVQVSAVVKGAVWLGNGKTDIELRPFKGAEGTEQSFELLTETPGTELALLDDDCAPGFIKYELVKRPERGGRGFYELKVSVPKGRVFSAIEGGLVVVQVKGTNQRMRIPVRGSGS